MNKVGRTILIITLTGLAGLPVCFSVYFLVARAYVRFEMEEELEKQQLQTITLNKHDVHWVQKGKEILVNNHLFDVENLTIIDEHHVRVEGLYDFQEDALHASLQQLLHNDETKDLNQIFPMIFFQFVFEKFDLIKSLADLPLPLSQIPIGFLQDFFPPVYYAIDTPPPDA